MIEAIKIETIPQEMKTMMDARKVRGYQIFKSKRIIPHPKKDGWIVPSQFSSKRYFVSEDFIVESEYYFVGLTYPVSIP